jgi:hypothetical protein
MNELCFNLWYYLAENQTITHVAARCYMLGGTDDEKGRVLKALSEHDFQLVPRHPPPKSLTKLTGRNIHYSAINNFGIEEIYAEVFRRIEKQMPDGISFPTEKLSFATPLYDFGDGYVATEIGDGFIRTR